MFKHTIKHIPAGKVKLSKSCELVQTIYDFNIFYFSFRVLKFAVLALFYTVILAFPVYGWDLIWEDDFCKDAPGLPDPAKWSYEKGYLRNKELQFYTEGRLENSRVENGMLIIEARKDDYQGHKYTAASLITRNKFSFTYGRIEMLAKIPKGKGVWPAFWTLGTDNRWPKCGEIDVMEYVGKEPGKIHGTIHWADGGHKQRGESLEQKDPTADFHLYAAEWYPDRIDFFFDKIKYFTARLSDTKSGFDHPHYILVNFALGGSWGGTLEDSILPQQYQIKYIKVYAEKKF